LQGASEQLGRIPAYSSAAPQANQSKNSDGYKAYSTRSPQSNGISFKRGDIRRVTACQKKQKAAGNRIRPDGRGVMDRKRARSAPRETDALFRKQTK